MLSSKGLNVIIHGFLDITKNTKIESLIIIVDLQQKHKMYC